MEDVERKAAVGLLGHSEGSPPARTKQYLITVAVCLGAFAAGTALSWTSSSSDMLLNNATESLILDRPITKQEDGWIGSLLAIGALIGAFPTGILCERIGRKWTILLLAAPFTLAWVLLTLATNVATLYAGRIFSGIATGGACVAIPMYVGEIAHSSIRGALGSFFQLLLTVGILYSYLVGYLVNYVWLGILSGVVPVLFAVIMFFMPESPTYLLKINKKSEAENNLRMLRGTNYDVKPEIMLLQEQLDEAAQNRASFRDLFASRTNINALTVGLLLMVFQQVSGINAVIFYTGGIFKSAGSTLSPGICSIIVGVVQVIATYISTVLVDRAGRRVLLLLSGSVMCACLIILGVYFHIQATDPTTAANIGWLPLLSVAIFIIAFSLGYGPLPWMMMGEIFPNSIKSIAASMAVCLNWTLTFIVTKTFGDLISGMGTAATFWLFSGTTAVGILFIFFRVPETKGKTYAEIQAALGGGS